MIGERSVRFIEFQNCRSMYLAEKKFGTLGKMPFAYCLKNEIFED